MNTTVFGAVFFSFLITSVIGCILKLTNMAYKSKCKEFSICCVRVVRDVELEEKETEFIATHRIPSSPSNKDLSI